MYSFDSIGLDLIYSMYHLVGSSILFSVCRLLSFFCLYFSGRIHVFNSVILVGLSLMNTITAMTTTSTCLQEREKWQFTKLK